MENQYAKWKLVFALVALMAISGCSSSSKIDDSALMDDTSALTDSLEDTSAAMESPDESSMNDTQDIASDTTSTDESFNDLGASSSGRGR